MTPLVSVAVITCNGARFLRKQLDSIYCQTYPHIEVIAVDDCSSDKTPEILDQYRRSHGLRYYVRQQNVGYLRNFEASLSLCKGEYIAPSDQDDIWQPEKIETLLSEITENSLICSDAYLIDENDAVISHSAMAFSNFAPQSGKIFTRLLFSSFVIGCTCLFPRSLVELALPIPAGEKYHDWWFSLVASSMNGIAYVPKPLVRYRLHERNALGLKMGQSLSEKLIGFLFNKPNRTWLETQKQRMKALMSAPQFNEEHKRQIAEAYRYYDNRLARGLHFEAFSIACKYRRQIFPWTRGFFRFKALLGCLFR